MSGLGTMMTGGNGKRQANDFYRTPIEATQALLSVWRPQYNRVWECAAGDGAMARVLVARGLRVAATDLHDYGYCESGVDFLQQRSLRAPVIVTNPPYRDGLPAAFIRHARELGAVEMALLLKATYWHTKNRYVLFNWWRPAVVYALTWRLDFLGLGAPTMDCIWVIWGSEETPVGGTRFDLLANPGNGAQLSLGDAA